MMGPPMGGGGFGGGPGGPTGPRPTRRNAIMVLVLPVVIYVASGILAAILGMIEPSLGAIAGLGYLVGSVLLFINIYKMLTELKAFTNNPDFNWWFILIPCLNYYFMWVKVPEEVSRAKQMAGLGQPARSIILYILLFPFALASDLNELAG